MRKYTFYGNTIHFFKQLWFNGPYPAGAYLKLTIFTLRIVLLFPISLWEQLFRAKKIEAREIHPQPLFIIGHYRSGTTLLHKILARDPRFIYLNGVDCIFPFSSERTKEKIKPFLKWLFRISKWKNQAFNNYKFRLEDPIEEDAFMIYANSPYSVFWGLIFTQEAEKRLKAFIRFSDNKSKKKWKEAYLFLCKKIAGKGQGCPLLLKSPPNTGRIKILLELFPKARFIHIFRNPYHVFCSMEKLLAENVEKFYSLHPLSQEEKRKIIFEHYRTLMDQLETDRHLLNAAQYHEVRYENFLEQPMVELERIYDRLKLGSFAELKPRFRQVLAQEAHYNPRFHVLSGDLQHQIEVEWGKYILHWGYHKPLQETRIS